MWLVLLLVGLFLYTNLAATFVLAAVLLAFEVL